jgi:Family of unknown function (DUF5681)
MSSDLDSQDSEFSRKSTSTLCLANLLCPNSRHHYNNSHIDKQEQFCYYHTMTKKDQGAGDYEVGYGRPPLHTRFKKGQSGNPRGRPSGPKTVAALLLDALAERVAVSEDGKCRRIAKRKLGIARLADKFAKGDPFAISTVLDILLQGERRTSSEPAERPPLRESDKLVIENLLARLGVPPPPCLCRRLTQST